MEKGWGEISLWKMYLWEIDKKVEKWIPVKAHYNQLLVVIIACGYLSLFPHSNGNVCNLEYFLTVWLADKRLTIIVYCVAATLGIAVCVFSLRLHLCYKASRMTNYRSARVMMKNGVNLCLWHECILLCVNFKVKCEFFVHLSMQKPQFYF